MKPKQGRIEEIEKALLAKKRQAFTVYREHALDIIDYFYHNEKCFTRFVVTPYSTREMPLTPIGD